MLVFFDVDGTLTEGSNVWEYIYRRLGIWNTIGIPIQERFLRGKITYEEFAQRDAAHFADTPARLLQEWVSQIPIRPQVKELLHTLQSQGHRIILLSTGLTLLTDRLAKEFGIFDAVANELEIVEEKASGKVFVHVSADDIHRDKGAWVRHFCKKYRVSTEQTVAVGDSAGDIPMFRQVELPILFAPADSSADPKAIQKGIPGIVVTETMTETGREILDFAQPSRYWLGWRRYAR
ncbi:HAD-IB family phosphatase [Heliobacillus mobilis]|uniref:phosphoserine phosphatase n=1 Tax=Heliobacterium mobile TaxID=28064 RepID=A0A6I3SGF5_HELMO|nr:HAD family phosphatase [Heliobacterium mobile]MTV47905.1 HAD-IB family phosphatase [Heliobacterium mobile]